MYENKTAKQLYTDGQSYYSKKDYAHARECWEQAAAMGYAPAQERMKHLYKYGKSVSQNLELADYFRQASNQDTQALFQLGQGYHSGNGVAKKPEIALQYYQQAADLNHPSALFELGQCYDSGNGVAKKPEVALQYYQQAAALNNVKARKHLDNIALQDCFQRASNGDAQALFELGERYHSGKGVEKNLRIAFQYYKQAADLNHVRAQTCLELVTEEGREIKLLKTLELGSRGSRGAASAYSPNGEQVVRVYYSSSGYGTVLKVWDVFTEKYTLTLGEDGSAHKKCIRDLAYSPNGERLVSASEDETLKVWNMRTGKCEQTLLGHQGWVNCCAFSPDGERVVSGAKYILKIWNIRNGQCERTIIVNDRGPINLSGVTACAFSPDGERVAAASGINGPNDGKGCIYSLYIWNVKSGKLELELVAHRDSIYSLAYSPDGERLVSASRDRTLKVWNMRTGQCERTLVGHTDAVLRCAYSPNGELLVSASQDKTVIVWNMRNGKCVRGLTGHTDYVSRCAFSGNGKSFISSSGDGTTRIWEVRELSSQPLAKDAMLRAPLLPQPQVVKAAPASSLQIIPRRELRLDKTNPKNLLGSGGFGVVYRGEWRDLAVAVKELQLSRISDAAKVEFEHEARLHGELRHPHIVLLFGAVMDSPQCIVMELMESTLFHLLHDTKRAFPWDMRARLAHEIALGLDFLHARKIIHRDLKSMNVLLDKAETAKLSDFGLAKVKGETMSTTYVGSGGKGTLAWMAPELFTPKGKHSNASDAYAYGMTLWEMCAREVPFAGAASPQLIISWVSQGIREGLPTDTPTVLHEIVGDATRGCWAAEPQNRPELSAILQALKAFRAAQGQPLSAVDALTASFAGNLISGGGVGVAAAAASSSSFSFADNLMSDGRPTTTKPKF